MKRHFDRAIIFLNGDETDLTYCKEYIDKQTLVVGCDGGTESIYQLGVNPDIVLGDFDSFKNLPVRVGNLPIDHYGKELMINDVTYVKYHFEKDFLDAELALDFVVKKNIKKIIIVNALGEEIDHVLGSLLLLGKDKYKDMDIKIMRRKQTIYTLRGKSSVDGVKGDKISLIPLYGEVEVKSSSGLKYDPSLYKMSPLDNTGISNELTKEKATLHINKGCFLVVHHHK